MKYVGKDDRCCTLWLSICYSLTLLQDPLLVDTHILLSKIYECGLYYVYYLQ